MEKWARALYVEGRAALGKTLPALPGDIDRKSVAARIEPPHAHRKQQLARARALPIRGLEQSKLHTAVRLPVHAERARGILQRGGVPRQAVADQADLALR